ncbi:hypothetical protein [Burkholderia glumae]|uniref:hypothetical protein n=1 Tax=Burkholderia glumae TaxID=337 RepID=UPI000F5E3710|nr:hypothetical protein [Burkholderia glumae]MCQ0030519.1 hypothetical protein [Burkholderia glumae]MCQ0038555.1 hypothetical protein [Burkholderia glumae]QJW78149.1 hypothetical protein GAS18_04890 [Burkholderia glumae]
MMQRPGLPPFDSINAIFDLISSARQAPPAASDLPGARFTAASRQPAAQVTDINDPSRMRLARATFF